MDTNIEIANGRVFVNGKETVDPLLIGYAMLDFAENMGNDIEKVILRYEEEDHVELLKEDA